MNGPANIIPFPAPSVFESIRRASLNLSSADKLNLIDALVEHSDLSGFYEADDIARGVASIRAETMPVETLDPYGAEQFFAAPRAGWPL